MSEVNDYQKRGAQGAYVANSDAGALDFVIDQKLSKIETAYIGRVDSCISSGVGGAKTVNGTALVAQTDADGKALSMGSVPNLPHVRNQAGKCAIILDPEPSDIGLFVVCKKDISGAKTKNPAPAKSKRSFSMSDAVYVGAVHTQTPTVYIHLMQDGKIEITAPAGCVINAPAGCEINAPMTTINGALTVTGGIVGQGGLQISGGSGAEVSGDVTADGISLKSHIHHGDSGGNTSPPLT